MPDIAFLLIGSGVLILLLVIVITSRKFSIPSRGPACSECGLETNDLDEYLWAVAMGGRARGMLCSDCAGRLGASRIGWKQVYPR